MSGAAKVLFSLNNLTSVVSNVSTGIAFVQGTSERGPFSDPSEIINSWPQFVDRFGGLLSDNNTPLLCKRFLEKGGMLRFSRVGAYTDIADRSTLTAAKASYIEFEDDEVIPNVLFQVTPKYAGSDYNNLNVAVTKTNSGVLKSFNLTITHNSDPTLTEVYNNLVYDDTQNYLSKVTKNSELVDITYLPYAPTSTGPKVSNDTYVDGTDGTVPQLTDYIGDSNSGTGLHSFDEYYDSYYLATFDEVDINTAGVAYCSERKDMAYIVSLEGETKTTIITEKRAINVDDKHAFFVGGKLKVIDPYTSQVINIKETADVLALAVNSDKNNGPWYSFAGPTRGLISNVLGVGINFGSPAKYKDLDELADNNINMVINRDGSTKLWGNFSGQMLNNQERYFNVVKLVFFIKKALRPVLENFLEEPNDIPTWLRMYYSVKPLFDKLKDERAIYNYDWQGDQFASSIQDLRINKPVDVTQGKYKVILTLSAINSIQEISVGIILTDAGVEFETINNLI